MDLTIKEIQEIETDILKEIDQICRNNKIKYFLNCGSVLGAIRHKGPIPWDHDVDIGVPINQLDHFIEVIQEQISDKYYINYYTVNPKYYLMFPRIGLKGYDTNILHIDVFKLVGIPSDRRKQLKFSKKATFIKKMYSSKTKPIKKSIRGIVEGCIKKVILLPFSRKWLIKIFEKHCTKYPYEQAEYIMNPCGKYGIKNALNKNIFAEGMRVKYSNIELNIPKEYDYYLRNYYGDYMLLPPIKERQHPQIFHLDKIKKEVNDVFIIKK